MLISDERESVSSNCNGRQYSVASALFLQYVTLLTIYFSSFVHNDRRFRLVFTAVFRSRIGMDHA